MHFVDELGSSFADGLLRLIQVGINLADGSSVYPNVPKGLSRAGRPVTSLILNDRAPASCSKTQPSVKARVASRLAGLNPRVVGRVSAFLERDSGC